MISAESSVLDRADFVAYSHRRLPVRDEHDRPSAVLLAERPQYDSLVETVKIARRLVEKHERRVMQKRPRETYPLSLAARERVAQLSDRRVVALRQGHDEIVDRRLFAGVLDLLVRRVELRYLQVVSDAVVEKMRLLRDKALHPAKVGGVDLFDRPSGYVRLSGGRPPEAHEELQKRGFSAAAPSGYADDASFRYVERQVGEYLLSG